MPTLARISSGLIRADDVSRGSGSPFPDFFWTLFETDPGVLQYASGAPDTTINNTINNANPQQVLSLEAAPTDIIIQVNIQHLDLNFGSDGMVARSQAPPSTFFGLTAQWAPLSGAGLYRILDKGVPVLTGVGTQTGSLPKFNSLRMRIRDLGGGMIEVALFQVGRTNLSDIANTVALVSVAAPVSIVDTLSPTGHYGTEMQRLSSDKMYFLSGTTITVTGLLAGFSARIRDSAGGVIASAGEVAGVATMLIGPEAIPATDLQVLDGGAVVQNTLVPTAPAPQLVPTTSVPPQTGVQPFWPGTIWGGDVYQFGMVPIVIGASNQTPQQLPWAIRPFQPFAGGARRRWYVPVNAVP